MIIKEDRKYIKNILNQCFVYSNENYEYFYLLDKNIQRFLKINKLLKSKHDLKIINQINYNLNLLYNNKYLFKLNINDLILTINHKDKYFYFYWTHIQPNYKLDTLVKILNDIYNLNYYII